MIADLENQWGVILLERGKNGVKLTSDGMVLFPYVKELCEKFDMLTSRVDELNGIESGIIRIGTFSSTATYWLPNIIKAFQKDYPKIEYEMLLGDYKEIEKWIEEGRVDCGFLSLPLKKNFETIFLERDNFYAVLPKNHYLAECEKVPLKLIAQEPFMLLEKGGKSEIAQIFEKNNLKPNVKFTTWDDYAVMSMVESGLGVSILPKLILQKIPYNIEIRSLDTQAYRDIVIAVKSREHLSAAAKRFLEYLKYR